MARKEPRVRRLGALLLVLLVIGCGPSNPTGTPDRDAASASAPAIGPKRLVASLQADPRAFNDKVALATSSGPIRGGPELEWLLNSALSASDDRGALVGQLAEAAPSIENGLWKLLPDGRMETTWHVRQGAQWHDGTPFTTEDLRFTADLVRDPELAVAFRDSTFDMIESIDAPDSRTIVVTWKGPLITADRLFGHTLAVPLPRHILEPTYNEDKSKLLYHPYWLAEFVGTGPFRLKSWVQGSHVVLQANPSYVLGRPKIDEIEARFILDPNAVISNVLAGTVDLTLGYALSLESALELRRQWSSGGVEIAPNGWIVIHPQFLNPRPAIVGDRRFRQALMHGLNRQEMADTLQQGMVSVAHVFLNPGDPDYPAVESAIVKYDYDARRAVQMIEELGYTRGADGYFTDAAGQRIGLEIQVTEGLEIQVKATFAVADAWQQIGAEVKPLVRSSQSTVDREETANFPSFRLNRQPNSKEDMKRYLIAQAPVAENRYTGFNFARYRNQEFNDLIERYFRTIPAAERVDVLRQIVGHMTEQLTQMGLFYNVQSVAIGKRVRNVTNSGVDDFNQAWNAHLWEVT